MVVILLERIPVGISQCNCYLVGEKMGKITVIDPGAEGKEIASRVENYASRVERIINTHGHFDHIGGNCFLREKFNSQLMIHQREENYLVNSRKNLSAFLDIGEITGPAADDFLTEGEQIEIGNNIFKVIHTPGHSPGGICLYCEQEKILFCGDLIFKNGVGRTDLPGGDKDRLHKSIEEKILPLADDTIIYPGHGEQTTIADFKENVW